MKATKVKKKRSWDWDCVFCKKSFSRFSTNARHILTHIKETPYFCQICEASFSKKFNLNVHIIARHRNSDSIKNVIKNKQQPKCSSCGKIFATKSMLKRHQQRRHTTNKDLRAFKCDLCPATFTASEYLQKHRRRHYKADLNLTCDLCDETLLRSMLGPHRLQCHPQDFYRNHRNQVVRRRRNRSGSQTRSNGIGHNHEGGQKRQSRRRQKSGKSTSMSLSFLCSICDATFRNESELSEHKKDHFEETTDLDLDNRSIDLDQDNDGRDKKKKKYRRKKIKFKCAFCPARFRGMERLEKHFTEVHKGNVAVNDGDDENLENKGTLKSTTEKKTQRSKSEHTRTINSPSPADIPIPMQ